MQQGYITLALGEARYFNMALNLALSAKSKDPKRPIALLHDNSHDLKALAPYFDHFVPLPADARYVGVANKLRLYDYSPYAQTMFLDSDCLIVKSDMDRHWAKFSNEKFNVAGAVKREGQWNNLDIADICRTLDLPFLSVMNSGMMYFEKSPLAQEVSASANAYYNDQDSILRYSHQGRDEQIADEPFFGAALARHGIRPIQYTPEEGSIMVTSWGAQRYTANPLTEEVIVRKPKTMGLLDRLLPFTSVHHSPTIMHFIGLKPKAVYNRLSNTLRRDDGLNEITL